jgi:hypothetical protein
MPEKPTGRSGFFRIYASGEATPVENSRPTNKAEIEQAIVDMFLRSHTYFTGEPFFLNNPRQNAENDYDFTVTSPKGDASLELIEIAPLAEVKGDYEKVSAGHRAGDLAKAVGDAIFKKSNRYQPKRELFLLVYRTHWSFSLGFAAIQLLRYRLSREQHVFSAVFYLNPIDGTVGELHWLYPVPPDLLANFRPEDAENAYSLNFDYRKFQVRTDGPLPNSPSSD